ncbi:hypothetical protein ebA6449 [Aromatoleum aromaticum EbN1]|uniref:Uncharacterized protein n=1 Tax=Aromatoleum aromaticum (strain DSM 19018 / LMG 30748 / EbN1) TaxID=76114 RepID=Q5NYQ2_AROAE|nr:hypothetical protein ebA6449 [Aromatoleum aromaticum EbN1]
MPGAGGRIAGSGRSREGRLQGDARSGTLPHPRYPGPVGPFVAARVVPPPHSLTVRRERDMARCDVCGNEYDKAFQVTMEGQTRTFLRARRSA